MAAPPITIGPFDNVPAPGSPIRSDWAQELTQAVANPVEWRNVATSIPPGSAMSGSPWDMAAAAMGVRGYERILYVTAGILFNAQTGADVGMDLYVAASAGVLGNRPRLRCLFAGSVASGAVTATFVVPAGVTATINTRLATASGAPTVTGGTLGGGDFNYVDVVAQPTYAPAQLLT